MTAAYEVPSGLSIVIHNPSKDCYYKFSLDLYDVQGILASQPWRPTLSNFPDKRPFPFFFKFCYCYKAFLPHLRKREVTTNTVLVSLVGETVDALMELHSCGNAHCDVRLGNICFCVETSKPILIDLERCKHLSIVFDLVCLVPLPCTMLTYLRGIGNMMNFILGNCLL